MRLANWNRYAAVNDEFVPIHMDDEAARAAGYRTAFGMGNLQWAYIHERRNLKDQTVTAHGRIEAVRMEGARTVIDLQVWTDDQDGVVLAPGTASVPSDPQVR